MNDIRDATSEDLGELAALYHHLHPTEDPCPPAFGRRILDQIALWPPSAIIVMGRPIVASCSLIIIPNLTRGGRPYGMIENVVTAPEARRQGCGHALLDAATERAWDAGCYKVMLMSGSTDQGVLSFYRRAGFEQSKTGFQKRRQA